MWCCASAILPCLGTLHSSSFGTLWHDTWDSKEVINSSSINKMTVNLLKPTQEKQKNYLRGKVAEINVFLGVPISHASETCLSQWPRLAFRSLRSTLLPYGRPLPGVYHASCMVKTAKHSALQHKLLNSNCLLSKTLLMASIFFHKYVNLFPEDLNVLSAEGETASIPLTVCSHIHTQSQRFMSPAHQRVNGN